MQGALVVEAARTAQKIHGVANITPAMMRDGMEALKIDQARWAEMGLANYAADINVTCENHGGPGLGAIQQWNASTQKWTMITDFVAADRSVVDPLIMADSAAYAAENNISERCN
jgi:branched-chain amino acid transport system substrate-binding protein